MVLFVAVFQEELLPQYFLNICSGQNYSITVHKYTLFEVGILDTTSNITQLRLSVFIFALSSFSFGVTEQAQK